MKFTPLTTRPSLTSRHGIMRLLSMPRVSGVYEEVSRACPTDVARRCFSCSCLRCARDLLATDLRRIEICQELAIYVVRKPACDIQGKQGNHEYCKYDH